MKVNDVGRGPCLPDTIFKQCLVTETWRCQIPLEPVAHTRTHARTHLHLHEPTPTPTPTPVQTPTPTHTPTELVPYNVDAIIREPRD